VTNCGLSPVSPLVEHLRQFELGVLNGQLAGVDLLEIENIAYAAEQRSAGTLDLF
jgi:hypothetical protein